MKKSLISLLIMFLSFSALYGADFDREKLNAFFNYLETHDKGFGSVSIFQDGAEVYSYQIGYSDFSRNKKIDGETKFKVGSVSKTFTAVIIMQMIEEGKLNLDTKLSEFHPQVKNSEKITIRHLLSHRSGIFNFMSDETFIDWMLDPIKKNDLLRKIADYEPIFEAGEKEQLSNSNYALLASIAERLDERDFDRILERRIFGPVDLTNTRTGEQTNSQKNEAYSHHKLLTWAQTEETHNSLLTGSGGLHSTPYDINKFFYHLFDGRLVSRQSLDEMTRSGLGLVAMPFNDKPAFGHTGLLDGFQSKAVYFPAEKTAVTYTTNGVILFPNDIVGGVLSIYFGMDYEFPEFPEPLSLDLEVLNKYVGVYQSQETPIKFTFFIENGRLKGQGTGQSAFPLDAIDITKFIFEPVNINVEFLPETDGMIFVQFGQPFSFTRVRE
ncbi:MAG: beta-lactamase family protein [Chitinispirillales bacterium]|nr:beta-lactamase family protein [Chitinispirillales bacterium]